MNSAVNNQDEERWLTSRQATWIKRIISAFTLKMVLFGGYLLSSLYLS